MVRTAELRALTILSSVLLTEGGVTLVDTPPYCSWLGGAALAQALAAPTPVPGPQSPSFCEQKLAPSTWQCVGGLLASAGGGSKFGETGARRQTIWSRTRLVLTGCHDRGLVIFQTRWNRWSTSIRYLGREANATFQRQAEASIGALRSSADMSMAELVLCTS